MTGQDDARYRLALAERSLLVAQEELSSGRWREAALFARGAVEQAMKAIIACFGAVPRTHEPGLVLDAALGDSRFPTTLMERARALRPVLDRYGSAEHLLLSYGDEKARIDPWQLVTLAHSQESTRAAQESVDLARACVGGAFASP